MFFCVLVLIAQSKHGINTDELKRRTFVCKTSSVIAKTMEVPADNFNDCLFTVLKNKSDRNDNIDNIDDSKDETKAAETDETDGTDRRNTISRLLTQSEFVGILSGHSVAMFGSIENGKHVDLVRNDLHIDYSCVTLLEQIMLDVENDDVWCMMK